LNNLITEENDESEDIKKLIVAQNLQNLYKSKAAKNYSETIKGALDREIKRQEETKV
jgi:hypothetical protein